MSGASLLAILRQSAAEQTLRQHRKRSLRRHLPERPERGKKPNILIIWGDDIGYWNISAYNQGMMGYKTPNIDRIAKEGALFTDWYGQQSCTAGRACFHHRPSRLPHRHAQGRPARREGRACRRAT